MKIIVSLLILLSITLVAKAQDSTAWSLEKCIIYASENNLDLKRQQLNTEYQAVQSEQKRFSLFPNLNANAGYNLGFGRVPDQSSYTYVNNTTQTGSAGVSSSTTLFEGFSKRNAIKKSRTDYQKSVADLDKTKNDICLQLANQYLLILYNKELLNISKEQVEITKQQVDQIEKRVKAGNKPMSALLDIKSQLAKESVSLVQAENDLNYAKLNLALMLNIESKGFDVVTPVLPELLPNSEAQSLEVYNTAVENMPEIKSAMFAVESSKYDLAIAKGGIYPTLSFNAGWGTNVSYYTGKTGFSAKDEFKNNSNSYLGLSLNIPIFNGHQVTSSIKSAKLGYTDAQYKLDQQKLNLRKEVEQASNEALSAYKKYLASQEALVSFNESFKYTQKRFDVEMVSAVDYNLAKTNLIKAQAELLQSKYEYIFKTKILDFYKGLKISL